MAPAGSPPWTAPARSRPAGSTPPPRGVSSPAFRLFVIMVALLVIVLLVYEVPFPQNFNGQFDIGPNSGTAYLVSLPDGVSVQGTWSALSEGPVALTIVGPQGIHVFEATDNAGSFSFVSAGGTYQFNGTSTVPQLVSIQGGYPATVLQMLNLNGGS